MWATYKDDPCDNLFFGMISAVRKWESQSNLICHWAESSITEGLTPKSGKMYNMKVLGLMKLNGETR